jgi:hypothetical protein
MPTLLTLCRDLSWVDLALAARLSRRVAALHDVVDRVALAAPTFGLRQLLLDVEDALLAHHPERVALERMVAELRTEIERLQSSVRVSRVEWG